MFEGFCIGLLIGALGGATAAMLYGANVKAHVTKEIAALRDSLKAKL